jgi:thioredoxin reductase
MKKSIAIKENKMKIVYDYNMEKLNLGERGFLYTVSLVVDHMEAFFRLGKATVISGNGNSKLEALFDLRERIKEEIVNFVDYEIEQWEKE